MLDARVRFVRVRGPIAKGEGPCARRGTSSPREATLTVFVAANDRGRLDRCRRLDHRARLSRAGASGHQRRARAATSTRRTSGFWSAPAFASDAWPRPSEALSDLALPACRSALGQAGLEGEDVDLLIVATVTPDMTFPSTAAILADILGAADAAAYDLSAGCTGFHVRARAGARDARRRPGEARARRRRRCASRTSTGRDARRSRPRRRRRRRRARACGPSRGSSASSSAPTGRAARTSGFRAAAPASSSTRTRHVKMNGREVFRFATRILVQSAQAVLAECGLTMETSIFYVPHQANVRIIDHEPSGSGSRLTR